MRRTGRATAASLHTAITVAIVFWSAGVALGSRGAAGADSAPGASVTPERRPAVEASPGVGTPPYQNSWAKDFIMDAPWRVVNAATPIPLLIALKDCGQDEIAALRWLRCRDVTGGSPVTLWLHDCDGERIGDDPDESSLWCWTTTVTEGHPWLPDGTPLTPANLGHGPGEVIVLEVSMGFRDNLPWDQTATRVLHVQVGSGPFPWDGGWFGGDPHVHTMFTNNVAEWGAPLAAVRLAAEAVGLHWVAATDHSCDLDETGEGDWSYATRLWRSTTQTPDGLGTVTHDVFAADGTAWGGLGAEIAALDGPGLRLVRGLEINLASVDPATSGKTLHALFYDCGYVASPLSGAPGERPVWPTLPAGLDALAAGGAGGTGGSAGFAYAAHPWDDLALEWAGVDLGVNGAAWGHADFAAALARDCFRGVAAFNTRATVASGDAGDPWDDFAAGRPASDAYPGPLLAGIARWDSLVRTGLAASPPRRVLLAGGSDSHGDFNYRTRLGTGDVADDDALGKVQTVVHVPGTWRPGALPPAGQILAALRLGRSIVTDGPFLELVLDRDRDGELDGADEPGIGDGATVHPAVCAPLLALWTTLPEFGPVTSVRVVAITRTGTVELLAFDPRETWQEHGGVIEVRLAGRGFIGPVAVRAELTTSDGAAGHRAFTNPIWLTFDASVDVDPSAGGDRPGGGDGGGPGSAPAPGLPLALTLGPNAPNPARSGTEIRFVLPRAAQVTLTIYDMTGRRVRSLFSGTVLPAGPHLAMWNGRDDRGALVASGAYLVRLEAGGRRTGRLLQVVR